LAALESVLRLYLDESQALREIPTLSMLTASEESVQQRAMNFLQLVRKSSGDCGNFALVRVYSRVGGGAMPEQDIASWAVAVRPENIKISRLETLLRHAPVPVVGRVEGDRLLLDMRTIADDELGILFESLQGVLSAKTVGENEKINGEQ